MSWIGVGLSLPAQAGDPGTTSANFLKVAVGARATGMGNAQVGLADDVYATYWNPAGLTQLSVPEAGFVHHRYIADINEQFAAYAHPTRVGTFAASAAFFNIGQFEGYDATGQPAGNVDAGDLALGLSYARPFWSNPRTDSALSAGVTLKYIRERLDTVSASAIAGDGGVFFQPGRRWGDIFQGFRAGIVGRNLGSSLQFDQESFPLPRTVAAGISWTGLWLGESLTIAVDGEQPNDGPKQLNSGLELWTLRTLVIRAGYTSQGDLGNGLRAGAGLRFKAVQIDYAWAGAGDFGNAHRFGITLRFGAAIPNTSSLADQEYRNGLRQFQQNHYPEALLHFNKALEIDSTHPQALDMMKQTYEKLKSLKTPQP